jgi:class 3 adenylate cyclase
MKRIESVKELVDHLRKAGEVIWDLEVGSPPHPLQAARTPDGDWMLATCIANGQAGEVYEGTDGLALKRDQVLISDAVYQTIREKIYDDESDIRRFSSRQIERAFVFVDVSDFSTLPSGIQQLVVLSLIRLARESQENVQEAEAELCIGDGYVYVFKDPVMATFFAAEVAKRIEQEVAANTAPEFHFRIGVHVGQVRCFWDPGRRDWNYVGEAINGAQRVLSSIGKETDDAVYVSAQVRQRIQLSRWSGQVLALLDNKGRKTDKHGKHWRVYQVNHTGFFTANARSQP